MNSLGISDELKQKLQDVMVDRHKLTLGKTLGEGEHYITADGICDLDSRSDQIKFLFVCRWVRLCYGGVTHSGGLCAQSCSEDHEKWVNSERSISENTSNHWLTSSSCCVLLSCYLHSHRDGRFPERSGLHEGVRSSERHAASRLVRSHFQQSPDVKLQEVSLATPPYRQIDGHMTSNIFIPIGSQIIVSN